MSLQMVDSTTSTAATSPSEIAEDFLDAAREGDVETVRSLLADCAASSAQRDTSIISAQDPLSGATALHLAAANGHVEVIRVLLGVLSPSVIQVKNASGNTPLHWAVQNRQWGAAMILLGDVNDGESQVLDVLITNDFGRSALDEASDAAAQLACSGNADRAAQAEAVVLKMLDHITRNRSDRSGNKVVDAEDTFAVGSEIEEGSIVADCTMSASPRSDGASA